MAPTQMFFLTMRFCLVAGWGLGEIIFSAATQPIVIYMPKQKMGSLLVDYLWNMLQISMAILWAVWQL